MYAQTKGGPGTGNTGKNYNSNNGRGIEKPNPIALDKLNTDNGVYLERCKTLEDGSKAPFYTGILFIDQKGNALMVKDYQDKGEARTNSESRPKIWHKLPGGVAENCFSQQMFLSSLEDQLIKMKYSNSLINKIIDAEEKLTRNAAERGAILECVEETGFYPKTFRFGCDGYRYNRDTQKNDLWQVYFIVSEILSPYSKYEQGIKHIHAAPKAIALDIDILDMRVVVNYNDLIKKVSPWPHKVAAQTMLFKMANEFDAAGSDFLCKKYRSAANFQI